MRRTAAAAMLACALTMSAPTAADAQVVTEVTWLYLEITGFQMTYQHFYQDADPAGPQPLQSLAGYIATPARPISVGPPVRTRWFKRVRNNDAVRHVITQCSGGPSAEAPNCIFLNDPFLYFDLGPGQQAVMAPDELEITSPVWLSCQIHPWMRAKVNNLGGGP